MDTRHIESTLCAVRVFEAAKLHDRLIHGSSIQDDDVLTLLGFTLQDQAVYLWRMGLIHRRQPSAGHHALAALAATRDELPIITQNVDDLHERAGSRDVIHLHGSLFRTRCSACARPLPDVAIPEEAAEVPPQRVTPPRCPHCHGNAP